MKEKRIVLYWLVSLIFCLGAGRPSRLCHEGYACKDPNWRFVLSDREVKAVLLAGSIGAFQDHPYPVLIQAWCGGVEIRNLSRVGYGASQLRELWVNEVMRNRRIPSPKDGIEMWLWWAGGLNSAGSPHRTNREVWKLFVQAHEAGYRVIGMTLTPWGSLSDRRWGGARGLFTFRNTQLVVEHVLGRLAPKEALGPFLKERPEGDAPWKPEELAEVRVDLFDSPLRDASAPLRDLDEMRRLLMNDSRYRREVKSLSLSASDAQLEKDAMLLAELPRWFLRKDLHAFDAIHPNREGHRLIAMALCPKLPASWKCQCPSKRTQ
ncbi:MAG: hypothetical protein RMJ84_04640 [Sandaracinaceae bacterium]|nr:hypothetical protein [Sandaracinaceae bacterium]